jgi:hypothetical protein
MHSNSLNNQSHESTVNSVSLGAITANVDSPAPSKPTTLDNSSHILSKNNSAIPRVSDFVSNQEDNTMADITNYDFCKLHMDHADIRREGSEHTGDIRREGAEHASNIRREAASYASDIRREGAEHTNEIVKEGLKSECSLRGDIKDARYDVVTRVESVADRLASDINTTSDAIRDRVHEVSRDTIDLRAQVTALGITVKENATITALQTEKAVLQNTIEGQKNTQYLSDKIAVENEKTRDLINELKSTDLNRYLIERNTELVEERQYGRHWRHQADQNQFAGQWAALQSQVQAFASQLQETRQGMVNFGTMAGVGQTSTSNNVR